MRILPRTNAKVAYGKDPLYKKNKNTTPEKISYNCVKHFLKLNVTITQTRFDHDSMALYIWAFTSFIMISCMKKNEFIQYMIMKICLKTARG